MGGYFFNKYCELNDSVRPETEVFFRLSSENIIKAQIVSISVQNKNVYTVQYSDGSIHEIKKNFILLKSSKPRPLRQRSISENPPKMAHQ